MTTVASSNCTSTSDSLHESLCLPISIFPTLICQQICRGHGGVPAVTFGRAAAHNYSALAGNISPSVDAYQKANSVADTFACQRLFYLPTFAIMCRVVSAGSRRCSNTPQKAAPAPGNREWGYINLSSTFLSLALTLTKLRIFFIEEGCLRKGFEAEAWSDVLNVF